MPSGWDKHPDYGSPGAGKPWSVVLAIAAIVLVAFGIAYCSNQASAQSASTTITGVPTVSDGDTLRFQRMRVRLWGIDAPEDDQMCGSVNVGDQSHDAMERLVEGRQTTCVLRDVDRNNRPVAICTVEGRDVGAALVEQGWAWDFRQYSNGAYAAQQRAAQSARRGVHAMRCELPWDLRARLRREAQQRRTHRNAAQ